MLLTMRQQAGDSLPVQPGSLQFTMEVEDAMRSRAATRNDEGQAVRIMKALLAQPLGSYAEQLLQDAQASARSLALEGEIDTVAMAAKLASLGYNVRVRVATGGASAGANSVPGSCFRNLRHEFLQVVAPAGADYAGVEFLVDPHFREQFTVSHPTPEYAALLDLVPPIFVGIHARLVQLVQVVCSEMARSFEDTQLTLPPWRRTQSMLSKWMPVRAKDIVVQATSSGGSSGAPSPNGTSPNGASPMSSASSSPVTSSGALGPQQQQLAGAGAGATTSVPTWLKEQQQQREEDTILRDLQLQFANLAAHNQQQASPTAVHVAQELQTAASPDSSRPVLGFEADFFKRTSLPPIAAAGAWQGFARCSAPAMSGGRQTSANHVSLLSAQLGSMLHGPNTRQAAPTAPTAVVKIVQGNPTSMTIHKVKYQHV